MTLNENDTLYFEKSTGKNADVCMDKHLFSDDTYSTNIDY
jgi:hypothetical protein